MEEKVLIAKEDVCEILKKLGIDLGKIEEDDKIDDNSIRLASETTSFCNLDLVNNNT